MSGDLLVSGARAASCLGALRSRPEQPVELSCGDGAPGTSILTAPDDELWWRVTSAWDPGGGAPAPPPSGRRFLRCDVEGPHWRALTRYVEQDVSWGLTGPAPFRTLVAHRSSAAGSGETVYVPARGLPPAALHETARALAGGCDALAGHTAALAAVVEAAHATGWVQYVGLSRGAGPCRVKVQFTCPGLERFVARCADATSAPVLSRFRAFGLPLAYASLSVDERGRRHTRLYARPVRVRHLGWSAEAAGG